jgi:hypothetical protein
MRAAASWLKANIDGAFQTETKEGAWGFIIRDHRVAE